MSCSLVIKQHLTHTHIFLRWCFCFSLLSLLRAASHPVAHLRMRQDVSLLTQTKPSVAGLQVPTLADLSSLEMKPSVSHIFAGWGQNTHSQLFTFLALQPRVWSVIDCVRVLTQAWQTRDRRWESCSKTSVCLMIDIPGTCLHDWVDFASSRNISRQLRYPPGVRKHFTASNISTRGQIQRLFSIAFIISSYCLSFYNNLSYTHPSFLFILPIFLPCHA